MLYIISTEKNKYYDYIVLFIFILVGIMYFNIIFLIFIGKNIIENNGYSILN